MKRIVLLLLFSFASVATHYATADEHDFDATKAKLTAAIADGRRSEADVARDKNRKPIETLEFFRFRDDMTVLELLPGGGWYTKLLGPSLEEKGKLYLSISAEEFGNANAGKPGFRTTEVIPIDRSNFIRLPGSTRTMLPEFSFGIDEEVDLALTFRNMHSFTDEGRFNINKAVFDALKSGGYYGVVDHTRRHMQEDSTEVRRRMDPIQIIKEVEAAGFRFVDFSDLHYRPDDELRYEVGRKTVTGNTDRFTLLFVKP